MPFSSHTISLTQTRASTHTYTCPYLRTPTYPRAPRTHPQVERSLAAFGTSYLDLVLLHYPRCFSGVCTSAEIARTEKDGGWPEAWRALGALAASGVVRARGVSNFDLDEVVVGVGAW